MLLKGTAIVDLAALGHDLERPQRPKIALFPFVQEVVNLCIRLVGDSSIRKVTTVLAGGSRTPDSGDRRDESFSECANVERIIRCWEDEQQPEPQTRKPRTDQRLV